MAKLVFSICFITGLVWSELPFSLGSAAFNEGMGLNSSSPFLDPIFQFDTTEQQFETGFTNYYSAPLDLEEKQLYTLYWGVNWRHKAHIFVATLHSFSAFNIYQEFSPHIGYAYQLPNSITLGATLNTTRNRAETHSQWAGSFSHSVLWGNEKVSGACVLSVKDIPFGFTQRPSLNLEAFIRSRTNLLGSQGMSCSYNTLSRQVSFSFAFNFPLMPWWSLDFALQTTPFFAHLGTNISVKRIHIGILLSRHAKLGWCQTVTVSYRS